MNKDLIAPIIISGIIISYGLLFHLLNVFPHNWDMAVIWALIYVSPVWLICLFIEIINKGNTKDEK